jgi:hypothetical protein
MREKEFIGMQIEDEKFWRKWRKTRDLSVVK